jgi:hypothetical protein
MSDRAWSDASPPTNHDSASRTISFHIRMDSLMWLLSVLPNLIFGGFFLVYYIEGRYSGYIPTFSETWTETPNLKMGCLGFLLMAILAFYAAVFLIMYINAFFSPGILLQMSLKVCTFGGAIGIVLTGCFPLTGLSYIHFFWAIIGMGGLNVVEFLIWFGCFSNASWKMNFCRGCVVMFQLLGLVACALSDKYGAVRHIESFSAVGEWVFILGLPFFLIPFAKELRHVSQRLVILDDPH